MFFSRFNFCLTFRPGSRNVKPDALSRQFSVVDTQLPPDTILPSGQVIGQLTWEVEKAVRDAQEAEPDPGNCPSRLLYVPVSVRFQVLQWGHSSKLTCHPGANRTVAFIRQHFWWPNMEKDTWEFVAACATCAWSKSSHQAASGLLQPLPVPSRPWSHISMDFITGLPPSKGKITILTIVDRFSKAAHFIPLSKLPSETVDLLVQHVIRLHGIPTDIVSDRGP